MSTDTEEFGALVSLPSAAGKPARAAPADSGGYGDSLHIRNGGGAAEEADVSRERWFETWLSLLSFKTLDQSGLFASDVGSSTTMKVYVEAVARPACVWTEESSLVGLRDGLLEVGRFLVKLATNVDVGCCCVHCTASDEVSFYEFVRITSKDLAILAGPGFALVGIDNKISGSTNRLIRPGEHIV